MDARIRELLREFHAQLEGIYGPRLRGVYLFGSYARGEADEESDVDVLVVLDDYEGYGQQIDQTSQVVSDLSLKYGVSVSRVFMRERDWRHGDTPFLLNVREEAVPA